MTPAAIVAELERVFLPLLNAARQQLATEYPELSFSTWSSSTGGRTSYQGYDVGLECLFPDARPEEANCVAASIGVWHMTTEAEFNSFGVAWGSGADPGVSVDLLTGPVLFSPDAANMLVSRVPELLSTLREAVDAWRIRGDGV